ncbi:chromosome transmission fidelity protein 8 homolog isoform X2 [Hydra vulgaris]|uniref:Chromosome transmission fidelity protein 8 homolog isoform X2 n=1 Tax=Hydra vulgaris TaxID=6087 RepID=A0ABM4DEN5_HYDVU
MVQVFIKLTEVPLEWHLIELQGALESFEQDIAGLHIGDLHFDEKGNPFLIVGHHVLTGKVVSLDKPFAVLKKNEPQLSNVKTDAINHEKTEKSQAIYKVEALIKEKIIFRNRPRPIIMKSLSAKS